MEAGRERDALIAEKVMGCVIKHTFTWVTGEPDMVHPDGDHQVLPHFSTDITAAWLVVQALEKRGFWCEMRTPFSEPFKRDGYWAGFTPHGTSGWNGCPDHWTDAATLPLAICLAALKAIEP